MAKFNFADHVPKKPKGGTLGKEQSAKAKNNEHEKKLIERIGAEKQPASGALPFAKGDYKFDMFLGDDKSTVGEGLIITRQMLIKINREALTEGKEPLISLSFKKIATTVPNTWALIPMEVFLKMLDYGQDRRLKDDFKIEICSPPETIKTEDGANVCTHCGEEIREETREETNPESVVIETNDEVDKPVEDIFSLPVEKKNDSPIVFVCKWCGSTERKEEGDYPAGHWWWICASCGRKV